MANDCAASQVNTRDVEQLWKDMFTYLYRYVCRDSLSRSERLSFAFWAMRRATANVN